MQPDPNTIRSPARRPRVAVITNIIPHYRRDFYRRVFANPAFDCHVFCQGDLPGANIRTVEREFPARVTIVPALTFRNERFSWQAIPLAAIRQGFDVCFVYGNPRVLSGVVASLFLRAQAMPIIIWGQAHSAESSPRLEAIRLAWWRRFQNIFVYNEDEVCYLRRKGFVRQTILGMNNGLDQQRIDAAASAWTPDRLAGWRCQAGLDGKILLLSCARLQPKNRFDLVVEALPQLLRAEPNLVWCVLGDGPVQADLKRRSAALDVAGAIRWVGPVYEETDLAPWFLSSTVLVHPGAIGLSLLHAFGYGLPVLTHDMRSLHMPEIAALEDGTNGVLFRHDDQEGLIQSLLGILADPTRRTRLGAAALATARSRFNTGVMATRFAEMVRLALCGPTAP